MTEHSVQCFFAQQNKSFDIEQTTTEETGTYKKALITQHQEKSSEKSLVQIADSDDTPSDAYYLQLNSATKTTTEKSRHHRVSPHHSHKPNAHTDRLIELINTNELGWKADPCKLQTHHHMYAEHCKKPAVALAQVKSGEEFERNQFGQGEGFEKALEKAQRYQKKYTSSELIKDEELPKHFDWRNVEGYDFTGEIRD